MHCSPCSTPTARRPAKPPPLHRWSGAFLHGFLHVVGLHFLSWIGSVANFAIRDPSKPGNSSCTVPPTHKSSLSLYFQGN
ncbi:hypothetical protein VIGAN_06147200 [Vigna angularis var. angularis]|uniref:Uncharacterized protein n=1 Tax=Vigna angularis var. angularis TaxID=157739 RepID=A0A0S3SBK9_PHAAN|nr:hypothetical protein VIGAN_06147200 [Vigna angularis var. angularis]